MSYFMPLFSLIFGLFGLAYAGAQVMVTPAPPSEYPSDGGAYGGTYARPPVQTCPELTLKCDFGYNYDNATGCSKDECAPDPAIKQGEWDAQCVKDKQREFKDFERNSIKDVERRFKELERGKIVVPAEARTAFEQMKAQWQQGQGLTTCQELQDTASEMYNFSNDLNNLLRDSEDVMNNARCVKDTTRELKDFERNNIKNNEDKMRKAAQKNIVVPPAFAEILPKMKELLTAARNMDNCNDLNEARNELYSINNELQEVGMQLDFVMQTPQMIKQITQEMKNIERQWKSATNKAKRSKADLSDLVARGRGLLDAMKGLFNELKAALTSGDMERIKDVMEGGDAAAREHEEEIFEIIRTIEALSNAPRYIKDLDRRVKDMRRQAKDMARFNEIDTSALASCLDNAVPLIASAREEAGRRPADPDAMMDAFSDVEEALSDCDEVRNGLEGRREEFFGEFVPDQMFNGIKGGETKVQLAPPVAPPVPMGSFQ